MRACHGSTLRTSGRDTGWRPLKRLLLKEITVPRWPIEDVRLDELDLDLRNVRIPFEGLDEAAIAAYLVESADLIELAGDILRDGYIDNEIPVVAVENGRRVVLEGNRRITALKAITILRYSAGLPQAGTRYASAP